MKSLAKLLRHLALPELHVHVALSGYTETVKPGSHSRSLRSCVLSQQIVPFTVPNLSNLLCAFRENHSSQHALLRLVEQCRKSLDKKGIVGMVLMDLSKAFDCLPHDLLIAKLEAYGFGIGSLRIIFDHLTSQKQRVKIKVTVNVCDTKFSFRSLKAELLTESR